MKPDDRPIAARRKTMSALKSILYWSSSFIVAFIAVALIVPMYVDYSSREESFAMIKRLEKMQKEIEPEIQGGKWVSLAARNIMIDRHADIGKIFVSAEGMIVAQGMERGQIVILMPSHENGKITWRCMGGSFKDVPPQCRNHPRE